MLAFLRRHGVAVGVEPTNGGEDSVCGREANDLHSLPNPFLDDPKISDEIPITIPLTIADLHGLSRGGALAVTIFGPASLAGDKSQNEDFALAGTVERQGVAYSFGIVADGVTSKTFWSARASRLAAFAAF